MKRLIIATLIMTAFVAMNAQEKRFAGVLINDRDLVELVKNRIAADLSHRYDKRQIVSARTTLIDDSELFWTDGLDVFTTIYDSNDPEIAMTPIHYYDVNRMPASSGTMNIKGRKVTLSDSPEMSVYIEVIAGHKMLVVRNAKGTPVKAFYYITNEEKENGTWSTFLPAVLAGNYTTPNGDNVVFGPKMAFYTGNEYDVDPGFYRHYVSPDFLSVTISYGDGRVSHGDPSSPKYGKMPGGGGAGALMGPMEWEITNTIDGVIAKVTHDEKFVDHNPSIISESTLTKVQCPFEGIAGKWAFASVIPLTHSLLKLFPKEVLTLMRGEIYARHGDSFTDPKTQRYFDAQPWYKKSKKRTALTYVERFNYDLIKQVENGK